MLDGNAIRQARRDMEWSAEYLARLARLPTNILILAEMSGTKPVLSDFQLGKIRSAFELSGYQFRPESEIQET